MDIIGQSACLVVNQSLFPLLMHDEGSGLRLNDSPDVKL